MANSARSPPATPCIKFLWRSETSVGLSIMSDPTLLPLIKPYVVNPIEGDRSDAHNKSDGNFRFVSQL